MAKNGLIFFISQLTSFLAWTFLNFLPTVTIFLANIFISFVEDGIELPGLFDHSRLTTESPESTTSKPHGGCMQHGQFYEDGASIKSEDPCEHCYCMKGDIVCAVEPCMGGSMEGEADSCVAMPPPRGSCCPTEYKCGK